MLALAGLALAGCDGSPTNLPIINQPLKYVQSTGGGTKYIAGNVSSGDFTLVVKLTGATPREWGAAYGALLKDEIADLIPPFFQWVDGQIDAFCKKNIPYLEFLCKIVEEDGVPAALDATRYLTEPFTPSWFTDELQGIADASGISYDQIYQINMFPELIRAACTMIGAWGPAVPPGAGLVQLRALDFGVDGPMAKHPVVTVYPGGEKGHPFANVGWTGLVGVLTGYSGARLGVSEKVFDAYDGSFALAGVPWMVALRSVLMFDDTVEAAYARLSSYRRTCAIYVGLGGMSSAEGGRRFRGCRYSHDFIDAYTDANFTSYANHPHLDGMMWWDKHVQPTHDTCLAELLPKVHGTVTAETYIHTVVPSHRTGDLHAAVYDFDAHFMYVANAKYLGAGVRADPAYNRPFVALNMTMLFA